MEERLNSLGEQAKREIAEAADPGRVEELRVKYLGKKGELSKILGGMGKLAPEERRALGEAANRVKDDVEALLAQAQERALDQKLEAEMKGPRLDVTLPGRMEPAGRRHPISRTMDEIVGTFRRLGFEVFGGPEIEFDYFNFEALNVPKDHPARDMQDTFYIDPATLPAAEGEAKDSPVLLRTHTSPMQIRAMRARRPPLRVVMPGRTFRRDSDITHTPQFHQVEALAVDKSVTFAELRGTLDAFVRAFFGASTKTRFRPSFFPFTEPSAEVDITCTTCGGSGCRVCKQTGWLEVLGAGMVHPNVFTSGGYDPREVTGFAFGMGVERITMLRYRIDDLRMLYENDVRFLEQF